MFQPCKMLRTLVWKPRMDLLCHFLLAALRRGGGSKDMSITALVDDAWDLPAGKNLAHGILCYMWKKQNGKNYAIRLRTMTETEMHVHMCAASQECILWCSKCFQKKHRSNSYVCSQAFHALHYNLHLCLVQEGNRIWNVTKSK